MIKLEFNEGGSRILIKFLMVLLIFGGTIFFLVWGRMSDVVKSDYTKSLERKLDSTKQITIELQRKNDSIKVAFDEREKVIEVLVNSEGEMWERINSLLHDSYTTGTGADRERDVQSLLDSLPSL